MRRFRARIGGTTTVEFAIVASALLMILFACIEFGRAMFVLAGLNEGVRRAARLAVVCPIGDPAVTAAVDFMNAPDFTAENVNLAYLDGTGSPITGTPTVSNVGFVQVAIQNYTFPLAIPFVDLSIASPSFTVTLPAESLGLSNTGVSTPC